MEWALPVAVTGGSIALTYFFCLRPMRNGHCAMMPQRQDSSARESQDNGAEIARLRAEVAQLRAQQHLTAPPEPLAGNRATPN